MLTEQELEKSLADVETEIANLAPDKELSNPDWHRKVRLVEQKQVLEKIQKAREGSDLSRETHLTAYYQLLIREKNMNPFWYYISRLKLKSTIWI